MEEHDTKWRSLSKAVSWRIIASVTTIVIVWIATGDLALSAAVGGLDVILKFILYFIHERGWDRIKWGKEITNNNEEA